MGQAVKYAALGVAIAAVLLLVVGVIGSVTDGVFARVSSAISSLVSTAGTALRNVKGALNYVLGDGAAIGLNLLIWMKILFPLLMLPVYVVITIYRWINQ